MTANVRRAFTLIEILIVILIIGMLLAIAAPNFVRARENSNQRSCVSNLRKIRAAAEQWAMDNHQGSGATYTVAQLVGVGAYLEATPNCPSGGTYTVTNVGADPDCGYSATVGGRLFEHSIDAEMSQ